MHLPEKKYKCILADPPWEYTFPGTRTVKKDDYSCMSVEDICDIPVKDISDDDCVLFLWCIFNKLHEALDVIEAWGFKYTSCAFVWIKRNRTSNSYFWGMGGWTRQNAECCLLGIKGHPKQKQHDIHSVVEAKIRGHSQKPLLIYEHIERLVGEVPKIELFARDKREGWDTWGNQVPSHEQQLLLEANRSRGIG